jgi:hypothetical protein
MVLGNIGRTAALEARLIVGSTKAGFDLGAIKAVLAGVLIDRAQESGNHSPVRVVAS